MGLTSWEPSSTIPSHNAGLTYTSTDYKTPSSLRSLLDEIEEEQGILDRQLKILDQRTTNARSTLNQLRHTGKTLSAFKNQTSSSILHLGECLIDLSLKADSTLSNTVRCSSEAAATNQPTERKTNGHSSYRCFNEFSKLIDDFSDVQDALARLTLFRSQRAPHDPSADSCISPLKSEVQRLTLSIRELERNHVVAELEKLRVVLERDTNDERLVSVEGTVSATAEDDVWVAMTMTRIWNREQASEMEHTAKHLKKFANLLCEELLPPLALVHSFLSILDVYEEEVFITIQALVDELDDVEADLGITPERCHMASQRRRDLDEHVKSLLKHLRDLRAKDASLLMLADRQDILSELLGARERYTTALSEVSKLSLASTQMVASFSASSEEHLSALVAYSPMNTTPPIPLPFNIQREMSRAKVQIAESSYFLSKSPDGFPRDRRARKYLDGFIRSATS
ncbi:hypothetical protein K439DRAFT_1657939 [Ramaria rubella]|nr:hypothetical protein K439DRAFT_1657939 [Ramaria rubella]